MKKQIIILAMTLALCSCAGIGINKRIMKPIPYLVGPSDTPCQQVARMAHAVFHDKYDVVDVRMVSPDGEGHVQAALKIDGRLYPVGLHGVYIGTELRSDYCVSDWGTGQPRNIVTWGCWDFDVKGIR